MVALIASLITSLCFAMPSSKESTMDYLRATLKQNNARLKEIDQATKKALTQPNPSEKNIDKWAADRRELLLRQDFLDRMIFRLDARFRGGDLKSFFAAQVKDMAYLEATSSESNTKLWKFLTYLTQAIQDIPEHDEDLAAFIEGYMIFSSITEPKSPQEFMKNREYTNGKTNVAAINSVDREEVGEVVEEQMKKLKANLFKLRTGVAGEGSN